MYSSERMVSRLPKYAEFYYNTVKLKSIYFEESNTRIIKTVKKYLIYKFLLNL